MMAMTGLVAGDLRQRITVEELGLPTDRDDIGGVTERWRPIGKRWAKIEPLRGTELLAAQQIDARITMRVTMRYLAGLTPSHRFLHTSSGVTRTYNVIAPLNIEERNIMHAVGCMEAPTQREGD
jgi:SPP1 family predicted phage head-tail adaptor